jgi:S1-C subfamily serine protease
MLWIRFAASLAVAVSVASYACAAPLEAELGAPYQPSHGAGVATKPGFVAPPKAPAAAYRKALDSAASGAGGATRGAAQSMLYKRAAPAVVLILTEKALGSGALITADGQIVTNLHVVKGAKQIGVYFMPPMEAGPPDAKNIHSAKVLKVDEIADLALIQVDTVPPGVTPLPLGDSSKLQVGSDVQAIGHPHGENWTYTRGIVSQIRRSYDWTDEGKLQHEATVIQTQTPINAGNSGGPLLDDQGAIVGINTFADSDGQGLNYAVSVEDVKSFLARDHDRAIAPTPTADCKWKTLTTEHLAKDKGTAEEIDTDCDGVGDMVLFTPDDKHKPQVVLRHEGDNDDGKLDTMYFDVDRDGNFDYVLYDTDGDGEPDLRGDFRKGETEPYRWERIDP